MATVCLESAGSISKVSALASDEAVAAAAAPREDAAAAEAAPATTHPEAAAETAAPAAAPAEAAAEAASEAAEAAAAEVPPPLEEEAAKAAAPPTRDAREEELSDSLLQLQMEMESAWGELRDRREENTTLRGELAVIRALIREGSDDGEDELSPGDPVLPQSQMQKASFPAPSFPASSPRLEGGSPTRRAQLSLNIFHTQFQLESILEELGIENQAGQALRCALDDNHLRLLTGGGAFDESRPRDVQSLIDEVLKRYGACCCR